MSTVDKIKQLLIEKFQAPHIEITDESFLHSTHPEALRGGGGHYHVLIVSDRFKGITLIERHRLIYETLQSLFSREIHAFTIKALTTEEWMQKGLSKLDLQRFLRTYIKPDSKSELFFIIFTILFILTGLYMYVQTKMSQ